MNKEKLALVKREAKEILKRIKTFEDAGANRGRFMTGDCPKEGGAVRRQSMELTRALADLRRP